MALLIAEPTAAPTMTSPKVGGGATTTAGPYPKPPITGDAAITGGAATTGGGATTVVLLMTVVLLIVRGGGGAGLLEGALPPMRPPDFAAWASEMGAKVTTRAARMERQAPPRRSGDGDSTSSANSGCEGVLVTSKLAPEARNDVAVAPRGAVVRPVKAGANSGAQATPAKRMTAKLLRQCIVRLRRDAARSWGEVSVTPGPLRAFCP
mmetsp:Transcript_39542/g.84275  ORF Transcript_39542/g.84275 Transcript_39542/m.84275 type:complete len:208 (+) Transcript_39542:373-996(+)